MTTVYITVTEEYYGGLNSGEDYTNKNPVRVFSTLAAAKKFQEKVMTKTNLDVVIEPIIIDDTSNFVI